MSNNNNRHKLFHCCTQPSVGYICYYRGGRSNNNRKWYNCYYIFNTIISLLLCRYIPEPICMSLSFRKLIRNILQYSFIGIIITFIILWLGSEYEQYHVNNASSTIRFYNENPQVCAFVYPSLVLPTSQQEQQQRNRTHNVENSSLGDETSSSSTTTIIMNISSFSYDPNHDNVSSSTTNILSPLEFQSYDSVQDAYEQLLQNNSQTTNKDPDDTRTDERDNTTNKASSSNFLDNIRNNITKDDIIIAHCGSCGACSNMNDIHLYDITKNTLFGYSTKCAKRALIWGRKTASNCLKDLVSFTDLCNDCWIDNILCDIRKCVFTCMFYGLFSSIDASTSLNRCTECDEKRCGPTFIQCAGANRRRCGIISDIKRNTQKEVCDTVQPTLWYQNNTIQLYDNIQRKQQQEIEHEHQN